MKKLPKDFKRTPYWDQDYRLRTNVIGDQLCFSIGSREDFKVFYHEDGHVEVAFLTNRENIRDMCKRLVWMTREPRKKMKKGEENEGYIVFATGGKG